MKLHLVGNVPMEPYLLKFLRKVENLQEGEALDLNHRNGIIPFSLRLLLTNKTNLNQESSSNQKIPDSYSARLRFKISSRMETFNQFFITRQNFRIFNRMVRAFLLDDLLIRILEGIQEGRNEKDIIYAYIRELDIEIDIPFETLKRALTRHRKSKKLPTIYQQKRLLV